MQNFLKVFFFGDSICVGQHVSIHKGWVTQASAQLSALGQKHNHVITVTNASGNGRTTREALERMPYEVQSQKPDILIVQFGMNDGNYWQSDGGVPRVSKKSFAANLEEIIVRARVFGVKRIFLNTNHPSGLTDKIMPCQDISYQQSVEEYNQIIRDVAVGQSADHDDVTLNDIEQAFLDYADSNRERLLELVLPAPDLLHLSEKGHRKYFELVYPVLEKATLKLIEEDA